MDASTRTSDEIAQFVRAVRARPCVKHLRERVEASDDLRVFVEHGFLLEFYNTHRTTSKDVMDLLLCLHDWTKSTLEPIVRSVFRKLCRSSDASTTSLRFACRVWEECSWVPSEPLRAWTRRQLEAMQCDFHTMSHPMVATLLLHLIDALGLQTDMIDLDVCEVLLEVALMTFHRVRGGVHLDTECVVTRLLTTVVREFPFALVYTRQFALHWIAIVSCVDVETSFTLLERTGTALLLVILHCTNGDASDAHRFLRSQEERDLAIRLWPTRFGPVFDATWTRSETQTTECECPITLEPMVDPVVASDGHVYERDAILTHLLKNDTSPLTREAMDYTVVSSTSS